MTALEEIKKSLEGVTPGPWEVYSEKVADKSAAIAESAYQVEHTEPFVGWVYMLNANGKCPAFTGCGPTSKANARYIAAVNPAAISELVSTLENLQRENEELRKAQDHIAAEKAGIAKNSHNNVDYWKSKYEAAEAEVKRIHELLRFAHDTLWEINPSNYDYDDVCKLNDASVEVILAIAPELGETHGKSQEWWAERRALASTGGDHHAE